MAVRRRRRGGFGGGADSRVGRAEVLEEREDGGGREGFDFDRDGRPGC